MPSSNERALEKAKTIPCDGLILDLEDAVAPDAKPAARDAACAAAAQRRVRPPRADDPRQRRRHRVARRRPGAPPARPARTRSSCPRSNSADAVRALVDAMEKHGAPDHTKLWAMVETPYAMLHAEEIAARLRAARPCW